MSELQSNHTNAYYIHIKLKFPDLFTKVCTFIIVDQTAELHLIYQYKVIKNYLHFKFKGSGKTLKHAGFYRFQLYADCVVKISCVIGVKHIKKFIFLLNIHESSDSLEIDKWINSIC